MSASGKHDTMWGHMKGVECATRVACDGAILSHQRVSMGISICTKCERTLKNRGKVIPPRGEKVK